MVSRQVPFEELPAGSSASADDGRFVFPCEVLDQFPTISQSGDALTIPAVPCPKEGLLEDKGLSTSVDADARRRLLQDWKKLGSDSRKGHEPWNPCRPRHWPSFTELRNSQSWKDYKNGRGRLLQRTRDALYAK